MDDKERTRYRIPKESNSFFDDSIDYDDLEDYEELDEEFDEEEDLEDYDDFDDYEEVNDNNYNNLGNTNEHEDSKSSTNRGDVRGIADQSENMNKNHDDLSDQKNSKIEEKNSDVLENKLNDDEEIKKVDSQLENSRRKLNNLYDFDDSQDNINSDNLGRQSKLNNLMKKKFGNNEDSDDNNNTTNLKDKFRGVKENDNSSNDNSDESNRLSKKDGLKSKLGLGDKEDNDDKKKEKDKDSKDKDDKKDSSSNKLNNALHPIKALKGFIKRKILAFFLNPYVLIITLFILFFLLLIFIIIFGGKSKLGNMDKSDAVAANGYYNAECSTMTVVDSDSGNNGTYDLEEYVAGVVNAEVGGFNNTAVYEASAVAARSYALANHTNCTIAGNTTKQAFKPTTSEKIKEAVANTNGKVLMKDGKVLSAQYDGLAIVGETSTDYIIKQQNQHIPKSWLDARLSSASIEYYKHHFHGNGMSQWGSYYLAVEKNYTSDQILAYYYGDVEASTIFGGTDSDNYTTVTSTGLNDQITAPLRNVLSSHGQTVESYNKSIMNAVKVAGPGTRSGVVAAISSLVGRLWEDYHVRLPYTYGGGHGTSIIVNGRNIDKTTGSYFGIDPDWGTNIGNFYYSNGYGPYHHYGPDCSSFVNWAVYNGGFRVSPGGNDMKSWGPHHKLSDTSWIGQPGDAVSRPGHIMIIAGVDMENHCYYIAEASSGSIGVIISRVDMYSPGKYANDDIVDLTNYYASHVITNDPVEYERLFLSNMYR